MSDKNNVTLHRKTGYSTDQKKPNRERVCERERNGYRTGMRTRTEWVQHGYRMDTERIQNGYRMDTEQKWNGYRMEMERIRNGYESQKWKKAFSRTQTI